jgi:hypothetical protein
MRGRLAPDRNRPHAAGRTPDWASVAWYVYDDPVEVNGGERVYPNYRVVPREMSPGELRHCGAITSERLVATVRRCSKRTVKKLLRDGVAPAELQGRVDALAATQAERSPVTPNAYRETLARLAEAARARNDRRPGEGVAP